MLQLYETMCSSCAQIAAIIYSSGAHTCRECGGVALGEDEASGFKPGIGCTRLFVAHLMAFEPMAQPSIMYFILITLHVEYSTLINKRVKT